MTVAAAARLRLPPRMVHADVQPWLAQVADVAGGVEIDASPLAQFDSSALAALVELRRRTGGGWQVTGVPDRLRELARLYGVHDLLFADPAPVPTSSAAAAG